MNNDGHHLREGGAPCSHAGQETNEVLGAFLSPQTEAKLSQLRQSIALEADLVLFDETLRCLKVGAARASYIITWISVAESLRAKFVTMAERDGEVQKIVGKIENMEKDQRAADKLILAKAIELGVVPQRDGPKLDHMLTMRHLYAHPYGQAPSPEEAVAALVIAVELVLSQPPMLRQGYVSQLLDKLFRDPHYLDDTNEAITTFASGVALRVQPTLHPYLLRKGLERLSGIWHDADLGTIRRRIVRFLQAYLAATLPGPWGTEWSLIELVAEHAQAAVAVLAVPELWERMDSQVQDMLIGYALAPVKQYDTTPLSQTLAYFGGGKAALFPEAVLDREQALGVTRVYLLERAGLLTGRQAKRLRQAISTATLPTLAASRVPFTEYVNRVVEQLRLHDWYRHQGPAMTALLSAGPEAVSQVPESTQVELGRNVLQSADGKTRDAMALCRRLGDGAERWPVAFVKGLVLECFKDERGRLRFKPTLMKAAIEAAIRGSEPAAADAILSDLSANVAESVPKYDWLSASDFDVAIGYVSEVINSLQDAETAARRPLEDVVLALETKRNGIPHVE